MIDKKEVAVQTQQVDSFITQALAANAPIETMERLFALHKEVKAEVARAEYTQAMAAFQAACPVIKKTKRVMNKDGQTVRYVFAPIDSIVEQIKKPLAENGFAYTFTVENSAEAITATAKVTHKLGHSETSSFTIPIDKEGYMTAPQKVASALTFAKRYALCNALGVSTGDDDTDATTSTKEPAAKSDRAKIVFLLRSLGVDSKDKAASVKFVKKHTDLDPADEKNIGNIVERLEVLVKEKQEYENSTIR